MVNVSAIYQYVDWYAILVIVALAIVIRYIVNRPRNLPPGPRGIPLLGNLVQVLRMKYHPEEMMALAERYGPVMMLKLGPATTIMLSKYDSIYEAFVTKAHSTTGRPVIYRSTDAKTGIIMKDGQRWKSLRRFIMSTLRDFGYGRNLIQERIIEEIHFIHEVLDKEEGGVYSDLRHLFTLSTSNVINALVFGRRFEYDDKQFNEVLEVLDAILRRNNFFESTNILDMLLIKLKLRKKETHYNDNSSLRNFVHSMMDEHKKDFDPANVRDCIDAFLKLSQDENSDVILQEREMFLAIVDLFLAGTETTATTLTWAFLYMIAFPEIQKRCQHEIDQLIDGNRQIKLHDRANLPYIDATLLEIQRYSSILPLGVPHRTTEDTTIGGYNIPKNAMLMSNIFSAHFDKDKFEAPMTFRPERFLNDEGKVANMDCVIPFSVGPRTCLGEGLARSELFLFFANLLNYFHFSKVDNARLDLTPVPKNATVREPQKYKIQFVRRSN